MEYEFTAHIDDNELTLVPDPFLEISCPFLGTKDDAGTPMGYPTTDNHCYARKQAPHVDLGKQRTHCLSDCYIECAYYLQQTAEKPAEEATKSQTSSRIPRFVNGRTLALGLMLILILLAGLIWWPPPGTSMEEGTVFGVSFSLNSPNVENEGEGVDTAMQPLADQQGNAEKASSPAPAVGAAVADVQQPSSVRESADQADGVKRSNVLEKSAGQGAALTSLSPDGAEAPVEVASAPTAAQSTSPNPKPKEVVKTDPPETVVEATQSNQPNDERVEKSPAAVSNGSSGSHNGFSPVAYDERESDDDMLSVYFAPGSSSYEKIARPGLVNLVGRDATAEWIKINTESGLEGWVLVAETELGSWVESLPEIAPE